MVQFTNRRSQPLRETREEVERDDEERVVRLVVLCGVGGKVLVLDEGLVDDSDAAFKDGLSVGDKSLSDGYHNRGEALSSGSVSVGKEQEERNGDEPRGEE